MSLPLWTTKNSVLQHRMLASQDYRGGLGAEELVRTLQSLLAAERTAIRLVCRYLADLADCLEDSRERPLGRVDDGPDGALGGHRNTPFAYADIYHAAECLFGLGAHSTRERIRVGRALRSLPRIEGALLSGELSYSRAREVTRVATPADESPWLERALTLPMRTLERTVVQATGKESPARTSDPARLRVGTPETVEVTLRLPAEAWALLQRAMEGARRASESPLSDAEALAAVARDAFERQNQGADPADPRRSVVLDESHVGTAGVPGASHVGTAGVPVASHVGTTGVPVASHVGTAGVPAASHVGTAARAGAGDEAAHLLALMGRHGQWSVDALVEASGLRVGSVQTALLCLEIDGRVASDGLGAYRARAPVGLRGRADSLVTGSHGGITGPRTVTASKKYCSPLPE